MIYHEEDLLEAISHSFQKYKEHGARSNEKLKPLHLHVATLLKTIWHEPDFQVHYLGNGAKELTVEGKYYPKDIDICLTYKASPIFCLGIKFVTSNYKQNANNYFEGMMGETANIQALQGLPYAQLIILRHKTPYYEKNETDIPKKIEIINEKDISKYLKLMFDTTQAHRPHFLGILLVDIDEKQQVVTSCDLFETFSSEFAALVENKLSLAIFFKEIENYKHFLIHTKSQEK